MYTHDLSLQVLGSFFMTIYVTRVLRVFFLVLEMCFPPTQAQWLLLEEGGFSAGTLTSAETALAESKLQRKQERGLKTA